MHINYLILSHSNYEHLSRLINGLDDTNVEFFIHIDKKTDKMYETTKANVHILKERSSIYWGGFGMISATLSLIKEARSYHNGGYYVLLSGVDYPIRSNREVKEVLSEKKEFMNISLGPLPHKPIERYQYYYFDIDRRNPNGFRYIFFRMLEKIQLKLKIKRKIPFKIYVGSQWFALTEDCIDYILKEIVDNPKYLIYFKHVFIPDEAFFHTILGNSNFYNKIEGNLTFVDWSVNPGPAIINESHLNIFQNNYSFKTKYGSNRPMFARKFDNNSQAIINKINSTLRKD
ncbi:MAG: beta-1,6-N-acetylglucosaminyltransferase [Maribacter arcticus]|uniref:beta-1,6-N-acetylglucosaminyltransferase n=1 Tax=Maribacter arcticus TaxID=561365 RepID=UPI00300357A3